MSIKKLIPLALIMIVLLGCQVGLSAQEQAATMVAQTAVAAPPTNTAAPVPTDTEVPPTITPAPTLTATPAGPLVFKDDFSAKTEAWGKCSACEWKDGKLYFGPFSPDGDKLWDQLHYLICEACGQHTYFRVSADITFASGQAGDRLYGIGSVMPDHYLAAAGISPYQYGVIELLDLQAQRYMGTQVKRYGAIKPGGASNHVEFDAKPNSSGTVDYYALVNGKTIIFLLNQPAERTKAALYFDWHSVGVTVDNFEFDEVVP